MAGMIKPILFNSEMVKAIMDGRKTVTRRIVKKRYENTNIELLRDIGTLIERQNDTPAPEKFTDEDGVAWYKHTVAVCSECNPPYQTGDVMYVRETSCQSHDGYHYRADGEDICVSNLSGGKDYISKSDGLRWHPSIHMPREAARIFLKVKSVQAERLNEITVEDALSEGVARHGLYNEQCYAGGCYNGDFETSCKVCEVPTNGFETLWNSTIKPADLDRYGWSANPWVWVISFERTEKPEDFV